MKHTLRGCTANLEMRMILDLVPLDISTTVSSSCWMNTLDSRTPSSSHSNSHSMSQSSSCRIFGFSPILQSKAALEWLLYWDYTLLGQENLPFLLSFYWVPAKSQRLYWHILSWDRLQVQGLGWLYRVAAFQPYWWNSFLFSWWCFCTEGCTKWEDLNVIGRGRFGSLFFLVFSGKTDTRSVLEIFASGGVIGWPWSLDGSCKIMLFSQSVSLWFLVIVVELSPDFVLSSWIE